jgi:hypothetical protein
MELDMKRTYNKAFENTFEAMQCLGWTVLYYDFDFDTREKLIAFQKGLTQHNKIVDEKDKYVKVDLFLKSEYGINCHKLACAFPYISKMKIADFDKRRDKVKAMLVGCDNAIEVFLVIFFCELIKEWGFTKEQAMESYEKMKENSMLYRQGMRNEFVQQYFKDEIDLVITM